MNRYIGLLCGGITAFGLAACNSNSQDFSANAAYKRDFTLSENYQLVYRRVYEAAKPCMTAAFIGQITSVDGQLYSELGYGQVTYSHAYGFYFAVVKVEKMGNGSRVSIATANQLTSAHTADTFEKIARGEDNSCS